VVWPVWPGPFLMVWPNRFWAIPLVQVGPYHFLTSSAAYDLIEFIISVCLMLV
jgi:hypothetical protein